MSRAGGHAARTISGPFDPCGHFLFLENPLQGCTGTKFSLEVSVSNNKCAEGSADWGYLCSISFAASPDRFCDEGGVAAPAGQGRGHGDPQGWQQGTASPEPSKSFYFA